MFLIYSCPHPLTSPLIVWLTAGKEMKVASVVLALVLSILGRKGAFAQTFECPICGDGLEVTTPGGEVSLPAESSIESGTCAELLAAAELGDIDATQCAVVQPFVRLSCGCEDIEESDAPSSASMETNVTDAPTSAPTETNATDAPTSTTFPTAAPTKPDCYKDLDEIGVIEWSFEDEETEVLQRTYILCPDTITKLGKGDPANPGFYIDGAEPIFPRPNSHYKCGEDGSLKNNCVLTGGDFAVVSLGSFQEQVNVVFEGIVFEKQFRGGFLFVESGDFTLIDCVFRVSLYVQDIQEEFPVFCAHTFPLSTGYAKFWTHLSFV
jgi:hypothetical protein